MSKTGKEIEDEVRKLEGGKDPFPFYIKADSAEEFLIVGKTQAHYIGIGYNIPHGNSTINNCLFYPAVLLQQNYELIDPCMHGNNIQSNSSSEHKCICDFYTVIMAVGCQCGGK